MDQRIRVVSQRQPVDAAFVTPAFSHHLRRAQFDPVLLGNAGGGFTPAGDSPLALMSIEKIGLD
jgi:hypothetical protein